MNFAVFHFFCPTLEAFSRRVIAVYKWQCNLLLTLWKFQTLWRFGGHDSLLAPLSSNAKHCLAPISSNALLCLAQCLAPISSCTFTTMCQLNYMYCSCQRFTLLKNTFITLRALFCLEQLEPGHSPFRMHCILLMLVPLARTSKSPRLTAKMSLKI